MWPLKRPVSEMKKYSSFLLTWTWAWSRYICAFLSFMRQALVVRLSEVYKISVIAAAPAGKSTHWDIMRAYCSPASISAIVHARGIRMKSPWAQLPPTPILWGTVCSVGRELICFPLSCYLAILITWRLRFLKPDWNKVEFLERPKACLYICCFPYSRALYTN